ncbi:MAG: hypothetical protein K2X93_00165 [Candidatus Obscuribacterales bacterium]|nr:hypothetical protein [Candidatus Obscuribacterales bacterium]
MKKTSSLPRRREMLARVGGTLTAIEADFESIPSVSKGDGNDRFREFDSSFRVVRSLEKNARNPTTASISNSA